MIRKRPSTIGLAGIQWLFFIFTNTVVVPLSLGAAFQLQAEQIAASLQLSFMLTGAACIVQALLGHRYAIMEGPTGVWWGLVLSLCASASTVGMSLTAVGGGIAAGILLSSLATIVLGALGFGQAIKKIFTSVVMGVSLLLLTIQLMMNFFRGMLVVTDSGELELPVTALCIAVALFTALLHLYGRGLFRNFSFLSGIIAGWIAYDLFFQPIRPAQAEAGTLLSLFPWGTPTLEAGIMITALIVGLINMTNTVTCLTAAEKLYGTTTSKTQVKRSLVVTGIFSIASGLFGLLPFGSFTSSIGFLENTKILQRSALVIGGGLMIVLGVIPALGSFFSTLPVGIGSAVLFIAYLQMFGTALRLIQDVRFNSRTIYRFAVPVLTGICIMNTPPALFSSLPVYIRPLVGNGLLMGVLLSLILEASVRWDKFDEPLAVEPKAAVQKHEPV